MPGARNFAKGRLASFGTNIFSEMTEMARTLDAVNLGQGFPNFDGPPILVRAATKAMARGENQYTISHGILELRQELCEKARSRGLEYDPEHEVTVTAGCTEAIAAALLAVLSPGDEVIGLEPFYDAYPALVEIAHGRFEPVALCDTGERFALDADAVERRITPRTRALLINTPHNPTGTVLNEQELCSLAELAKAHNLVVISDEVYEDLTYDGPHLSIASLPGMYERTIVCSSATKSFSITGWRVGWAFAPSELTLPLRIIHRFLSFCAPAPFQKAVAEAFCWSRESGYFEELMCSYRKRRDTLYSYLCAAGLAPICPSGTYYMIARTDGWAREISSLQFCRLLATDARVVALPLESFYVREDRAHGYLRFAFCKDLKVLSEAGTRLTECATLRELEPARRKGVTK